MQKGDSSALASRSREHGVLRTSFALPTTGNVSITESPEVERRQRSWCRTCRWMWKGHEPCSSSTTASHTETQSPATEGARGKRRSRVKWTPITLCGIVELGSRDDTNDVCKTTTRARAKDLNHASSHCAGSRVAGSSQGKHQNISKWLQDAKGDVAKARLVVQHIASGSRDDVVT